MPSIYDFLPPGAREQAGYAGLGALAQALLAGGAPTTTPGGGMAALGQGFSGFSNAYNQRLNSGLQQAMVSTQLAEAQRKQKAQADLADALQGVTAPIQVADASQPGATSMANRMNGGGNAQALYQQAMATPKAQAALMELYGPQGIAAIKSLNAPMAIKEGEGLYVPGQGWVLQPGNTPKTDIGKLIAERDKLQPGDPNRAVYDGAIQKALTEGGFTYGANGPTVAPNGPADPRYIERKSFAEARGAAPFKTVPTTAGGSVVTPFAGVGPGTGAGASTQQPPQGKDPRVVFSDPNPGPNTQAGKIEEYLAERFVETQKAGVAAGNQNRQLEALNTLLDKAYTGKGADTILEIQKGLTAAGIDPAKLGITSNMAAAEAGRAIAGQMALELRNPAGGAGMPGAMSDADRVYLQNMSPSLANTKEGRELMIETRRALNDRSREVAEFARQYARDNGGKLDLRFEDKLAEKFASKPLFGESFYKKLEAAAPKTAESGTAQPNVIGKWDPKTNKLVPY